METSALMDGPEWEKHIVISTVTLSSHIFPLFLKVAYHITYTFINLPPLLLIAIKDFMKTAEPAITLEFTKGLNVSALLSGFLEVEGHGLLLTAIILFVNQV